MCLCVCMSSIWYVPWFNQINAFVYACSLFTCHKIIIFLYLDVSLCSSYVYLHVTRFFSFLYLDVSLCSSLCIHVFVCMYVSIWYVNNVQLIVLNWKYVAVVERSILDKVTPTGWF